MCYIDFFAAGIVLSTSSGGSALSQGGAASLTSSTPGGFVSQSSSTMGAQFQTGTAQPGSAAGLASAAGSGEIVSY